MWENRLSSDTDITMSMVSPFLWNTVYIRITYINNGAVFF